MDHQPKIRLHWALVVPFEVVYSMNPIGHLDLAPFHIIDHFSGEVDERAKFIKKIHEQVRDKILKQTKK